MGTPSPTITEKQWNSIIDYVQQGYTYNLACECARVSHETFYKRMRENPDYSERVKEVRAESHAKSLKHLIDSDKDQTHQWLLERTRRHEFGKDVAVDTDYEGEDFVVDNTKVERKLSFITKEEAEEDND